MILVIGDASQQGGPLSQRRGFYGTPRPVAAAGRGVAGHRRTGGPRRRPAVSPGRSPTMGLMPEPTRRVLLAKPRGYCAGSTGRCRPSSRRWSTTARRSTCASRSCTTCTWSATLEERGAIFVEETDEVPEGAIVVFSAHGVAPAGPRGGRRTAACARSTPPARWSPRCTTRPGGSPREDYDILLIGHEGHEEVVGTTGEAPDAHPRWSTARTTATASRSATRRRSPGCRRPRCRSTRPYETVGALRERFPQLLDPPSDDICYATQNRQAAVKQIARGVRPGHRRRLAELLELGAPGRGRARGGRRARPTWSTTRGDRRGLARRRRPRSGVTSGASVPGDPGRRGARLARRARLRRRRGGQTAGRAGLRPAAGAAPPARRPAARRLAARPRPPHRTADPGAGRAAWPGRSSARSPGHRRPVGTGPAFADWCLARSEAVPRSAQVAGINAVVQRGPVFADRPRQSPE